jgi:hypothetical protein
MLSDCQVSRRGTNITRTLHCVTVYVHCLSCLRNNLAFSHLCLCFRDVLTLTTLATCRTYVIIYLVTPIKRRTIYLAHYTLFFSLFFFVFLRSKYFLQHFVFERFNLCSWIFRQFIPVIINQRKHNTCSHKQKLYQVLVTGFGYLLAIMRPTRGSIIMQEIIQCVTPIRV